MKAAVKGIVEDYYLTEMRDYAFASYFPNYVPLAETLHETSVFDNAISAITQNIESGEYRSGGEYAYAGWNFIRGVKACAYMQDESKGVPVYVRVYNSPDGVYAAVANRVEGTDTWNKIFISVNAEYMHDVDLRSSLKHEFQHAADMYFPEHSNRLSKKENGTTANVRPVDDVMPDKLELCRRVADLFSPSEQQARAAAMADKLRRMSGGELNRIKSARRPITAYKKIYGIDRMLASVAAECDDVLQLDEMAMFETAFASYDGPKLHDLLMYGLALRQAGPFDEYLRKRKNSIPGFAEISGLFTEEGVRLAYYDYDKIRENTAAGAKRTLISFMHGSVLKFIKNICAKIYEITGERK